ncbi:MAG: NAD(+)/NADH kinase [Eggerthellaceae bacterium]|nr:NAD(+)/NADH kinase [Eggerthellaceae bacterium]
MHILIVRNNSNPRATDASLLLAAYLGSQGIGHALLDSSDVTLGNEAAQRGLLDEEQTDLVVVLGGDGTILRCARLANGCDIPLLGINFGTLGFLANPSEDGVVAIVAAALSGDVVCEDRANLRIDVACEGDGIEASEAPVYPLDDAQDGACQDASARRSFFALNEMALTRGGEGKIIDFDLGINEASIAHLRGDGLVVATATGSTAHALSAGGPLVAPAFKGLVVVPLAPHSLQSRALVTASSDVVEVCLADNQATRAATLFADGERIDFDSALVRVWVRTGERPTRLLRYKSQGFFEHASEVFFR